MEAEGSHLPQASRPRMSNKATQASHQAKPMPPAIPLSTRATIHSTTHTARMAIQPLKMPQQPMETTTNSKGSSCQISHLQSPTLPKTKKLDSRDDRGSSQNKHSKPSNQSATDTIDANTPSNPKVNVKSSLTGKQFNNGQNVRASISKEVNTSQNQHTV